MADDKKPSMGDELSANWMTKAFGAVILAGILAWTASVSANISDVTGLKPQIETLQAQQERNTEWITTWPTQGELSGDVAQNERILRLAEVTAELKEENRDLETKIDAILEGINQLKIDVNTLENSTP